MQQFKKINKNIALIFNYYKYVLNFYLIRKNLYKNINMSPKIQKIDIQIDYTNIDNLYNYDFFFDFFKLWFFFFNIFNRKLKILNIFNDPNKITDLEKKKKYKEFSIILKTSLTKKYLYNYLTNIYFFSNFKVLKFIKNPLKKKINILHNSKTSVLSISNLNLDPIYLENIYIYKNNDLEEKKKNKIKYITNVLVYNNNFFFNRLNVDIIYLTIKNLLCLN